MGRSLAVVGESVFFDLLLSYYYIGVIVVSASKNKNGRFLPEEFDLAHQLCFVIHDVMVQIIKSGEEGDFFNTTINVESPEQRDYLAELDDIDDVFSWLEEEQRNDDKAQILKTTILPAILSDMMHCIFETLETSRKAKLGISYMLIRKPLQESLYLLESVVLDELDFSEKLTIEPQRLGSKNAGGVDNHAKRIEKVLEIINATSRFNPRYIAQLRYDKAQEDSFDGICNKAMHLFTNHKAIRTEKMNINFVFSGWDQKITQWDYLYSRLPYLLLYTLQVVENILETIAPTSQEYLDDIQRRISASILLWWPSVDENYKCDELEDFVKDTESWLNNHCSSSGYSTPLNKDLVRMAETGAYPKENYLQVKKRGMKYSINAAINKITAR